MDVWSIFSVFVWRDFRHPHWLIPLLLSNLQTSMSPGDIRHSHSTFGWILYLHMWCLQILDCLESRIFIHFPHDKLNLETHGSPDLHTELTYQVYVDYCNCWLRLQSPIPPFILHHRILSNPDWFLEMKGFLVTIWGYCIIPYINQSPCCLKIPCCKTPDHVCRAGEPSKRGVDLASAHQKSEAPLDLISASPRQLLST